jgi:hypothetical protein
VMSTSLRTSVSSGTEGVATVIFTTSVPVATQQPVNQDPQPSSKSKTPIIVGCAVGIPLGLAVIALLILLLRRRNKNKPGKPSGTSSPHSPDPPFTGHTGSEFVGGYKPGHQYRHDANTPELDPQSVGPGRPISTIKGMAELPSGTEFGPGVVPQAPHLVGVGGGNGRLSADGPNHSPGSSWGSAPPGYSAEHATGTGHPNDYPPMRETGAANVTAGGRYVPYRPPQEEQTGLPGIAELPAVKTPPELPAVKTPP